MSSTALKQPERFSRDSLHGYQRRAVDFVKSHDKCALWVDMGLGKTVSTLTAVADLLDGFEVSKVLIIAPKRVAEDTWPKEIHAWEHTRHLSFAVAVGNVAERVRAVLSPVDLVVINRENVPWLVEYFAKLKRWPFDMIVIDEASSFKSSKSARFKALRKVLPKVDRLVELTATPSSNGLLDIWSQIFLLDGGERLGKTMTKYKSSYFDADWMGYNFTPKQTAEAEIYSKLSDIVLTLSAEDYLDMPKRIEHVIDVHMPAAAREQYRELERHFLLEIDDQSVTAINAAVLTNKLLQFCNGAIYTDDQGSWSSIHDAKLDALEAIVEEAEGQPVLIAYNFKSDLARLQKRIPSAETIDAPNAIDRWNAGKISVLLAHPASAGHGLNLQHGGSVIVWFGLNWSLELYQQFNGRLYRQGQTKPVVIYHLAVTESVDQTVLDALANKNTTQKALLNALKSDIGARA